MATLIAEGDRFQFADPSFRRELGSWVHSRRAASQDGMSGADFGMPDMLSPVGAFVIRTFDLGNGVAAKDQQIAEGSPALGLLFTRSDTPREWLATGEALMRVLLTATAAGVTTAYLNQPIEVSDLRARLRATLRVTGMPQILFRMGYGLEVGAAVRRPVSTQTKVLLHSRAACSAA